VAEEEGFEPPIPFQVRQFSRLEPSTTRPLFREFSLIWFAGNAKNSQGIASWANGRVRVRVLWFPGHDLPGHEPPEHELPEHEPRGL
jgi:hypothetical protein